MVDSSPSFLMLLTSVLLLFAFWNCYIGPEKPTYVHLAPEHIT